MDQSRLRSARSSDAAAISALHGALFSPPWTDAEVAVLTSTAGAVAMVVEADHGPDLWAFVLGRVMADEAEVLSLGVVPAAQRQGIGRRLVEALAADVRKRGAGRLYLEVSAANTPAIALYRGLGFTHLGRRRGYYRRQGAPPEDALLLGLELEAPPHVD